MSTFTLTDTFDGGAKPEHIVRAARDMRTDTFRVHYTGERAGSPSPPVTHVATWWGSGWESVGSLTGHLDPLKAVQRVAKAMGWHS